MQGVSWTVWGGVAGVILILAGVILTLRINTWYAATMFLRDIVELVEDM